MIVNSKRYHRLKFLNGVYIPNSLSTPNEEELLLFTLLSLKSGLTYDLLGIICGMNGSNAHKNQKIGLSVLTKTLNNLNLMPERKLLTIKDFEKLFAQETDLIIIDATEQRIQRPGDSKEQKESYSGKKN